MNELVTIPFTDKTLTKASALRLVALLAVGAGVYHLGRKVLAR
jgi:hypothetical protein